MLLYRQMPDPPLPCDTLWTNARLATMRGEGLGLLDDGVIAALEGRIVYVGPAAEAPGFDADMEIDCDGRWITPGLIDCHTHLVHAGDRAHEFAMRLEGATYEEIARAGGGIVSTMRATRDASEDELVATALPRLDALIAEGVTTIEVKSGYGLTVEDELKMLRAARALGHERDVRVATTFLGAHALPPEYAGGADGYIDLVCDAMIPAAAGWPTRSTPSAKASASRPSRPLACSTRRAPRACRSSSMPSNCRTCTAPPRRASWRAVGRSSRTSRRGRRAAMAQAGTVAVLLPGAFYFMRETKLPPVELLRRHGVPIALATDCNPGTSPLTSLLLTMNMGATLFRLTVDEALRGVTATRRARWALPPRSARSRPARPATWRSGTSRPAELVYRIGFNSLHSRVKDGQCC